MERGTAFLKAQINNAVMQHRTFVENLEDHEQQADDPRYRDLCARFLPKAMAHQQMLEAYQAELGTDTGTAKKLIGKALGVARDLADATRESDFLRLVGDIVTSRQSEDTFKTFRDAGRALGLQTLATLGDLGEKEHDVYAKEANTLAKEMFVEQVRSGDTSGLLFTPVTAAGSSAPESSL